MLFPRHCEEQRDEAIHLSVTRDMDCFASLAMTGRELQSTMNSFTPVFVDERCAASPKSDT